MREGFRVKLQGWSARSEVIGSPANSNGNCLGFRVWAAASGSLVSDYFECRMQYLHRASNIPRDPNGRM